MTEEEPTMDDVAARERYEQWLCSLTPEQRKNWDLLGEMERSLRDRMVWEVLKEWMADESRSSPRIVNSPAPLRGDTEGDQDER